MFGHACSMSYAGYSPDVLTYANSFASTHSDEVYLGTNSWPV